MYRQLSNLPSNPGLYVSEKRLHLILRYTIDEYTACSLLNGLIVYIAKIFLVLSN